MTRTEILWLGLRTDREKEIFAEGFWHGVGAPLNEIRKTELRRLVERDTTTVQRLSPKGYGGDEVDGQC